MLSTIIYNDAVKRIRRNNVLYKKHSLNFSSDFRDKCNGVYLFLFLYIRAYKLNREYLILIPIEFSMGLSDKYISLR